MPVDAAAFQLQKPTPQPPIRAWQFKSATPWHLRKPRMQVRQTCEPNEDLFLGPHTGRSTSTTPRPAVAGRHLCAAVAQSVKQMKHVSTASDGPKAPLVVPCAHEAIGDVDVGQSSLRPPRDAAHAPYDYAKHTEPSSSKRLSRSAAATLGDHYGSSFGCSGDADADLPTTWDILQSPSRGNTARGAAVHEVLDDLLGDVQAAKLANTTVEAPPAEHALLLTQRGRQQAQEAALERQFRDEVFREQQKFDSTRPHFSVTGGRFPGFPALQDQFHNQLEKDIEDDAVLFRMRRHAQADMNRRARIQVRHEAMRASQRAKQKASFEHRLSRREPYAMAQLANVVSTRYQQGIDAILGPQCGAERKTNALPSAKTVTDDAVKDLVSALCCQTADVGPDGQTVVVERTSRTAVKGCGVTPRMKLAMQEAEANAAIAKGTRDQLWPTMAPRPTSNRMVTEASKRVLANSARIPKAPPKKHVAASQATPPPRRAMKELNEFDSIIETVFREADDAVVELRHPDA